MVFQMEKYGVGLVGRRSREGIMFIFIFDVGGGFVKERFEEIGFISSRHQSFE